MNSLQTYIQAKQFGLVKKQAAPGTNFSLSSSKRADSSGNRGDYKRRKMKLSAFEDGDMDDDLDGIDDSESTGKKGLDVERARVNLVISGLSTSKAKETETLHSAALSQDESIFDYDSYLDSVKLDSKSVGNQNSALRNVAVPAAKYVQSLQAAAKVREIEKDRIYERKLLKERMLEDKAFPETEKFVTAAYKEKLKEQQKWDYEDKRAAEIERRNDVRKLGMEGFYGNLLTKNIALGNSVESSTSAYTPGSQRQNDILTDIAIDTDISIKAEISKNVSKRSADSPHDDTSLLSNDTANEEKNFSHTETDNTKSECSLAQPLKEREKLEVVTKEVKILSARDRYLARKTAGVNV